MAQEESARNEDAGGDFDDPMEAMDNGDAYQNFNQEASAPAGPMDNDNSDQNLMPEVHNIEDLFIKNEGDTDTNFDK